MENEDVNRTTGQKNFYNNLLRLSDAIVCAVR